MKGERRRDPSVHRSSRTTETDNVACSALDQQAIEREIEQLDRLIKAEPFLSEQDVAALLGCKVKTLQNRRHANPDAGPIHVRLLGSKGVTYPRHHMLQYLACKILMARGRRIHRA